MEDKLILEMLNRRNEEAIAELDRAYRNYCLTISQNILNDEQYSEEVLNDTWLKVWNSIPPNNPASLKFYCGRITRNLALDRYNYLHADRRSNSLVEVSYEELMGCLPAKDNVTEEFHYNMLRGLINTFLETLNNRDRIIFIGRYFYFMENEQIASRYHLTNLEIRNSLYRTRKKLKDFLEKEEYYV